MGQPNPWTTLRLTAKNRDQLRNPTLGSRVWAIPLPFLPGAKLLICSQNIGDVRQIPILCEAAFLNAFRYRTEIGGDLTEEEPLAVQLYGQVNWPAVVYSDYYLYLAGGQRL